MARGQAANASGVLLKIELMKLIDRLAGGIVTACLSSASQRQIRVPRKFLVIRPGGIGDAVLLMPALRALQVAYPGCSIEILAEKRNAAAFGLISGIGTIHLYDSPLGIVSVLRGCYDVVIDTEQWYRLSTVVARLTGTLTQIGFATNKRKRLFSHPVSYDNNQYEAYSFFELLEPLGISIPPMIDTPFLELPNSALVEANRHLEPLSGRPLVTVFPGASAPEKQWGTDNFLELISLITARGIAVVLIGGEDTRCAGKQLAMVKHVLDLTGRTSIMVTAALIKKSRVLVTGDSGLLHVAVGLGAPTVSLFGPSNAQKWGPQGDRHLLIRAGLPCAPCSRFGTIPPCAVSARCLSEIRVAEAFAAVEVLLSLEYDQ